MGTIQKSKVTRTTYIFYTIAIVTGVGIGILFSQNMLRSQEKRSSYTPDLTTSEEESLSEEEINQLIAERATLIENGTLSNAQNAGLHPQIPPNPIEIEKLNKKVKNFDPTTKAGEENADKLLKITWYMLKDVKFEERYYEEVRAYLLYPIFGNSVKKLEGKEVYIRGFIIPADEVNNIYVLSANSYASCFFCGNAGPESVMDLDLEVTPELKEQLQLDAVFTFKGRLKLNADNIDYLNYILEDAQIYDID